MAFSNSKLVDYVKLSPNCNKPRKYAIKKITIHHMAGNLSVETCGNVFYPTSRQASSNYAIDSNGRVGMYVEECNRSWCSSNAENDHQAITIEVANDEIGGNWHVSDKALNKLVELCVDICKRNGIERLNFTGDKTGNLTMHKYFAATSCPGPYLSSKFPWIAEQVNKKLATTTTEKPLSESPCRLHIGPASSGDVRTIRNLIDELGIKTEVASGYITTSAASKGDQITIITKCKELAVGCKIYEEPKPEVVIPTPVPTTGLQATALKDMTNEQIIAKVGPLFTADQKKTGVLASVSMAQFLVESAYGKSELAQNANNCFGMKQNLSGNTWAGSKWDGKSIYEKITKEFVEGEYIELKRPFRKYACIEDSIEDHSAYLLGAKRGAELRYAGLKGETNYKVAAQLIKNGGYATSPTYVTTLCNTIEKLGLTKFDVVNTSTNPTTSASVIYRVRKSWDNPSSQLGAFSSLENAKAACKAGYYVFDANGKAVYPVETKAEFTVGNEVKLVSGAKYTNGKSIPNWILKAKLYVREIRGNGDIVFSTLKTGAVTGVAAAKYFVKYASADAFKSYKVTVNCDALNVRKGPGVLYGKVSIVHYGDVLTIVQEKNGWGQISGTTSWVSLKYTKKK